jgi:NADH-quinone oxidoreductase subunit H
MNALGFLLAILYTLIFPGFLFTAILGLWLTWVDRKVTAVIQSRIGPPWYQPFADIGKLFGKKMILPTGSEAFGFIAAPILAVSGSTLAAVILFRALINPSAGFVGDLIVLIYLLAVPAIALIVGGSASRSPFGAIGAGREMSMVLAYEAAFLVAVASALVKVGSVRLEDILAYQQVHGPIVWSVSGVIALCIAILCIQAKLGYLPFDISEADTEIIGGPLAEYSGVGLALFKISRAMLALVMPALVILLFTGGIQATFWSALGFLLKLTAIFVVQVVIKATHARLRLDQALALFWKRLVVVGLIGIALALLGW